MSGGDEARACTKESTLQHAQGVRGPQEAGRCCKFRQGTRETAFEQSSQGNEEPSHESCGGGRGSFQAEGLAGAKALRLLGMKGGQWAFNGGRGETR